MFEGRQQGAYLDDPFAYSDNNSCTATSEAVVSQHALDIVVDTDGDGREIS